MGVEKKGKDYGGWIPIAGTPLDAYVADTTDDAEEDQAVRSYQNTEGLEGASLRHAAAHSTDTAVQEKLRQRILEEHDEDKDAQGNPGYTHWG